VVAISSPRTASRIAAANRFRVRVPLKIGIGY
jgi:hypothetical protein